MKKPIQPKEKPILFSAPMVQSILARNKSQTRRTTGLKKVNEDPDKWEFSHFSLCPDKPEFEKYAVFEHKHTNKELKIRAPFGDKKGDLIWVRESFLAFGKWELTGKKTKIGLPKKVFRDLTLTNNFDYKYTANLSENIAYPGFRSKEEKWNKRNSIHMPKAASRIWLELEGYSIERLQDISEADAVAEGISYSDLLEGYECLTCGSGKGHVMAHDLICEDGAFLTAKQSFQSLWYTLNGIESWHENPWLWVVKFKVLSVSGKPQQCYKTGDICRHNCKGLCRESM